MKKLIGLVIVVIAATLLSCGNEEDVMVTPSCEVMQVQRDAAYVNWQETLKGFPSKEGTTLDDVLNWQVKERDTKAVYMEVEKFVAKNCYGGKMGS